MHIDLRSDTVTKPTAGMRRAIASAEVGDDYLDGDPTTKRLEEQVANLLGKDRALFFPSGTMANQCALAVLSEPGTEIYADHLAHIVEREMAGAAALAGVQIRTVRSEGPMMDAAGLSRAFRPFDPYLPRATLVCLENTHNSAGGLVAPVAGIRAMHDVARERGCKVHLDGARLWNAAVASGSSLAEFAEWSDTTMVSFSKGLGAPAGAILAGSDAVMHRANEMRKRLGGVMRQSGILSSAALYGLEHHFERLSEDHARAADFAHVVDRAIAATVMPPETNIVMVDLAPGLDAANVARKVAREGVLVSVWTPTRVRVVLHIDVSEDEARTAALTLLDALDEAWRELGDTSDWPVVAAPPRAY